MNGPSIGFATCALLAATAQALPSQMPAQQGARGKLVTPGSFADDSMRLASITTPGPVAYSLLRSPSTLTQLQPSRPGSLRWAYFLPELYSIDNSALPYSLNDGWLWAGRGWSSRVRAGLEVQMKRVRLVLGPELLQTDNLGFMGPADWVSLPRPPGRNPLGNPWHTTPESIDLPVRFGTTGFTQWDWAQSSVDVDFGRITAGLTTENEWWGPGIQNAIVMSTNAAGIPRLFTRPTRPIATGAGTFDFRLFAGGLRESAYFDTSLANNWRSISGVALAWTPRAAPNVTVGFTRAVYAPVSSWSRVPTRLLDALIRNPGRPNNHLPGDTTVVPGPDQVFSFFGRWAFPGAGFEVYTEWARNELPTSLRDFLTAPNHTQGYTLGLQWARPAGPAGTARVQLETTYLGKSATLRDRPVGTWYTSRAVPQGYTNRGQVIGAAIGPGASSQWLAVDYVAPLWQAGVYAYRIRWDGEALYRFPTTNVNGAPNKWCSHDTSMIFGVRAAKRGGFGLLEVSYGVDMRRNVFFEQRSVCGQNMDMRDVRDAINRTLEIRLTPP